MQKKLPLILLVLLSSIITLWLYYPIVFHPNDYLFSNEGDGIKNYFTYCYHIKYDHNFIDFEGMNYPYGEHFLYTDCHPVVANFIKLIACISPLFSEYSIGILNFMMILSIYLTFIVTYYLLLEFNINKWFSLLFCIGITILAPQIFRLVGHLALSYSVAIPLSWLLLIKVLKNQNNRRYIILLLMNNIFWLFIHSYLGIISLFFLSMIIIVKFMLDKHRLSQLKHYLGLISNAILPILLFYAFAILTDTHINRTDNPSGFFQYNAELDDVFLPHHPPLKPLFDKLTGNIIAQQWEAWSYVGITTALLFVIIIVLSFIQLFKRNPNSILYRLFDSSILNVSFISAIVVLLFALAVPFKQIDGLIDYLPFVKPFRATGRFTWPFYFVALVFSANVLQKMYDMASGKKQIVFITTLCVFVGCFNILEGLPYHSEISKSITTSKNVFKRDDLSISYIKALQLVDSSTYQAIITFPFYYQGSECFSRPRSYKTVSSSFVISYHTGIPIMCANFTRTSVTESKKIVQIVSPAFYTKQIQYDLKSTKPFLVITTNDGMTDYEKEILQKCKALYISEEISIYSLQPEDLFHNHSNEVFEKYQRAKANLYYNQTFQASSDSSFLYYNGFEKSTSKHVFRGKGGFQSLKAGKNTFAEFAPNTFKTGKTYHVSLWMYNGMKDALNDWFRFIIEEHDNETGNINSTTYFPEQIETIHGNWSLLEGTFEVKNTKSKILIITKGKEHATQELFVDDLLIKENGVDIYKLVNNNELFYNNHQVLNKFKDVERLSFINREKSIK
ncbi:MAG: hypothetical protein ACK50L_10005 [Bacteroidota bacterium]